MNSLIRAGGAAPSMRAQGLSAQMRPYARPHSTTSFSHAIARRRVTRFNGSGGTGREQQSRRFLSFSRYTLKLLRLPFMLVGGVTGGAAYVNYKAEEMRKQYVPEWVSDAWGKAKKFVDSVEFGNMELPKLPELDLSKFGSVSQPPATVPSGPSSLIDPSAAQKFAVKEEPIVHAQSMKSAAQSQKLSSGAPLSDSGMPPPDEDLMLLTKKLIEVRNLLKKVNTGDSAKEALKLPSIVVVGSQSSGKSSVLEAIVGHEFLPKGTNMVTRRPIELTLINTPNSREEYGEFPQLGLGKVHDYKQIQKTLTDLNLAVSDAECVSAQPIELKLYSPSVPDLTLIDLPGYIAIHNRHQPAILKEKIAELCEQYIREPNIILAVCAADVDLANSEALRASRKVDPQGKRTIGVITKMDLVDPNSGVHTLTNSDYPLNLGYIGVVCKGAATGSKALIRSEDAFFRSHSQYNSPKVSVGTPVLRRRLMQVLEENLGKSLTGITYAVERELDDARYQFKVQYNDRRISAESYVAESMDQLKTRFKEFAKTFGKPQVRDEVRAMLEQRIVDISRELYWENSRIGTLPKACIVPGETYWGNRLDIASGMLTKSGVGKAAVQQVVDNLMRNMEKISSAEPFGFHPETRRKIMAMSNELLRNNFHTAVDQVENTIKPYKYEVECTEQEWTEGVKRSVDLMERELDGTKKRLQDIKSSLGRRKMRQALAYLQKLEKENEAKAVAAVRRGEDVVRTSGAVVVEDENTAKKNAENAEAALAAGFTLPVLEKAKEAVALNDRVALLTNRVSALRSRQCATSANRACCPEAFLSVVSEKLAYTATMFIWVELLNEFFFQMPREIDETLYYGLGRDKIVAFAKENEGVRKHLEVQERKVALEAVMEKLKAIMKEQKEGAARGSKK
ncbi:P-loop containing nucleoside triphosphate hydrolase protein [Cladochytrium replicatum]|nr:P-loop containing nucleoside triphosphate hydrolase protein [Cladochytrium replicatum]